MNLDAQGLQSTCPHGIASTALVALVSALRQLGQLRTGSPLLESFSSMKLRVVRVFNEYSCGLSSEDPGHIGFNFAVLATMCRESLLAVLESGVCEGTQKEGRVDLEMASRCREFISQMIQLAREQPMACQRADQPSRRSASSVAYSALPAQPS